VVEQLQVFAERFPSALPRLSRSLAFNSSSNMDGGGGAGKGSQTARGEEGHEDGASKDPARPSWPAVEAMAQASADRTNATVPRPPVPGAALGVRGSGGRLLNSSQAAATLERILETDVTMFLSHDSGPFIEASNASSPLHLDVLSLQRFLLFHSEHPAGIGVQL